MIKTRFAPSPTGDIHIGNARTALFSFLLAIKYQGDFILRIEDTDYERSEAQLVERLMTNLRWLLMDWQEGPDVGGDYGPYWQSQRNDVYQSYYQRLRELDLAYPCFCSEDHLAMVRKSQKRRGESPRYPGTCRSLTDDEVQAKLDQGLSPTLRFKIPRGETIAFEDWVKGMQHFEADDIGDFIIQRSSGAPSFMFCNAIDDALMGITHVLRGEDHQTNTPRQLLILRALGLPEPHYGHIALILGLDGSPLSKRNGSKSVEQLHEEGYLPLAIMNYLARLGHYYPHQQLLSVNELAAEFEQVSLAKSPSKFDEEQLYFWQKQTVQSLDEDQFWQWLSALKERVPQDQQTLFYETISPNVVLASDAYQWVSICLEKDYLTYSDDAMLTLQQAGYTFFETALHYMQQNPMATADDVLAHLKQQLGVTGKRLFLPIRLALTAQSKGPKLGPLFKLLGTGRIQQRLQHVLELIHE